MITVPHKDHPLNIPEAQSKQLRDFLIDFFFYGFVWMFLIVSFLIAASIVGGTDASPAYHFFGYVGTGCLVLYVLIKTDVKKPETPPQP